MSNETKWSPGPWHSEYQEHGGYDCMTAAQVVYSKDCVQTICLVDYGDYGQEHCSQKNENDCEEAVANARLIAAAPDMAEACEAVDRCGRDANADGDVTIPSEVWDLVRQALAKARGES